MKKVVAFLEAYVQWIALGLAILWLGYIGYGYWYQHPVVQESRGQLLPPGELDVHILTTIKPLMDDIANPKPFASDIAAGGPHGNPFTQPPAPEYVYAQPFVPQYTPLVSRDNQTIVIGPKDRPTMADISQILQPIGCATGHSLMLIPQDPPPAGGAPPQPIKMGKFWVTVSVELLQDKLAAAWSDSKLPIMFENTEFLRVQLFRQEWVDGQWVNQVQIKELPIRPLQPWPPAAGKEQRVYADWAAPNAADIIEPPMYQVVAERASDPWRTASMPVVNPAMNLAIVEPPYDPSKQGMRPPRTLQEQQMLSDWLAKVEQQRAAAAQARESQATAEFQKNHPGYKPPVTPARTVRPPVAVKPKPVVVLPPPTPPAPATQAAPSIPEGQPIPQPAANKGLPGGAFSPAAIQNLEIWAHDDTVQPGHTYRYMIKLFLLNPLFGTNNVAKNPADAQQYTLEADSDWESAVTVPPDSYFYITNDTGLKQDVQIEVFNWKDGLWSKSKPPKVSAGDVIGTTGWTMVDTRRDLYRDQTHVLLRDPNGQLVIRTAKQDKSDPNYIQLTGEDAGHASATGGIPGMP